MEERITARVSRTRKINMFAELSHANHVLLENAREKRDGYFYEVMSCIIVAAFKFEAYLNQIGSRLFSFWDELDRLPPKNKLTIIASRINVTPDFGRRPYQTLNDLFNVRNKLAHPKPEPPIQMSNIESGTREELRRKKPLSKWEQLCTIDFAVKAYEDTETIAEQVWASAGFSDHLRPSGHSYTISPLS